MKNKTMSSGEALVARTNIEMIEERLGRPIPAGLLDVTEYGDHILTPREISNTCYNINQISNRYNKNYPNKYTYSSLIETKLLSYLLILMSTAAIFIIPTKELGFLGVITALLLESVILYITSLTSKILVDKESEFHSLIYIISLTAYSMIAGILTISILG